MPDLISDPIQSQMKSPMQSIMPSAFGDCLIKLADQHQKIAGKGQAFDQADVYAVNILHYLLTQNGQTFNEFLAEKHAARLTAQLDSFTINQVSDTSEAIAQCAVSINIINDSYAAINCALKQDLKSEAYRSSRLAISVVRSIHDLASHQEALNVNLLDTTAVTPSAMSDAIEAANSISLIKLPKQKDYFSYLLSALNTQAHHAAKHRNDTIIVVTGMQRYFSHGFYDIARKYFKRCEVLPGIKKAKAILLSEPVTRKERITTDWFKETDTQQLGLQLFNLPNVFSSGSLDIGSRFLIENLPEALLSSKQVLDIGCGNGLLSLYIASKNPSAQISANDDSSLALSSVEHNIRANKLDASRFTLIHAPALLPYGTEPQSFDLCVCNPPFHQEHNVSEHIGLQMIEEAAQLLVPGGKLLIVFNRDLQYANKLKSLFKKAQCIKENKKFKLYLATA